VQDERENEGYTGRKNPRIFSLKSNRNDVRSLVNLDFLKTNYEMLDSITVFFKSALTILFRVHELKSMKYFVMCTYSGD